MLSRSQRRTRRVLRFGNFEMVDKCIESSFSVVVGVDSRLWWAKKQVGGEEETVIVYAGSLIEKKKERQKGWGKRQ